MREFLAAAEPALEEVHFFALYRDTDLDVYGRGLRRLQPEAREPRTGGGKLGPIIALGGGRIPAEVSGKGRFVVSSRQFTPAYLRTYEESRLREKIDEALEALRTCTLCPRNCRVNRFEGKIAVCKVARYARVSSHFPHFGEEDVLRGWNGSGTIFFAWCNLRCQFCQNFETSQIGAGEDVGSRELARMMLELQARGCHNINFVTPEHVVPQILEALPYAIEAGLRLPIVYNTSAYDSLHSIHLMDGVVDIYMPDFNW